MSEKESREEKMQNRKTTRQNRETTRQNPGEGKFSYFSHKQCEYFPCHRTEDADNFNCLFCYCPLYTLGERCGGNFRYTAEGVKDCSECMLPHKRENYGYVIEKYDEIMELARKKSKTP